MIWFNRFISTAACSLLACNTASGSPIVAKRATGTCTSTEFTADSYVGNYNNPICESNWGGSYAPIISITAWGGPQFVTGIQVTYSDHTQSPVYGLTDGKTAQTISADYASGNLFKSVVLWATPPGQHVAHLSIANTAGDTLQVGVPQPGQNGYDSYPQPIGSGVLYGFEGSTDGTRVNGLGFYFLSSKLQYINVNNIAITNLPQGETDIFPTTIETGHRWNGQTTASENWVYTNAKTDTHTVTHTYSQTSTNTFGGSTTNMFSGQLAIPLVHIGGSSSSTSTYSWTTTYNEQNVTTTTEVRSLTCTASGTLGPSEGIDLLFTAGVGIGTFPYTSTVTLGLADGHQYSFTEAGSLTVNDISDTTLDITPANHP